MFPLNKWNMRSFVMSFCVSIIIRMNFTSMRIHCMNICCVSTYYFMSLSCFHYFSVIFCNSANISPTLKYIIIPKTGKETRIDANIAIQPVPKSASSISQMQTKASKLAKIIKEILRRALCIKK